MNFDVAQYIMRFDLKRYMNSLQDWLFVHDVEIHSYHYTDWVFLSCRGD